MQYLNFTEKFKHSMRGCSYTPHNVHTVTLPPSPILSLHILPSFFKHYAYLDLNNLVACPIGSFCQIFYGAWFSFCFIYIAYDFITYILALQLPARGNPPQLQLSSTLQESPNPTIILKSTF